ncbi:MAG: F-type H+-transporting ATPase subunit b, partial [Thermoleophilaceae bacterium]|nr:F-type H+-transporting ATPase subunit b [Thermoleophilaceae bacterium]
MGGLADISFLAQAEADSGGSFLVSPNLGLMIWTLLAFGITLYLLNKLAFPRIAEALDKRRRVIEESIEQAQRAKR